MDGRDRVVEVAARITPQWLAGFFDGDGCVSVHKAGNSYAVRVDITQNDPIILGLIATFVGSGKVHSATHNKIGNTYFRIAWQGKECRELLMLIKDHVICKRVQVEAAVQFLDQYTYAGGRITDDQSDTRTKLATVITAANLLASNRHMAMITKGGY